MRRLHPILGSLVAASMLASCSSGGNPATPNTNVAQLPLQTKLPKVLRLGHTPAHPPPRRHVVTAAMRARAKKGGWTELSASSPFANGADSEIQMTDGTVLVRDYCTSNWFKLTPDKTGSYQDGTWSAVAALPSGYGPLYFASAILPDGKLIINGGEYNFCSGDETPLGAIYDPVANTWASVSPPSGWGQIGDGQSVVLANGTYMIGNCCTSVQAEYDESTSTWTQVGSGKADANSEEGWTLLRTGDVLTADVIKAPNSELFNPTSGSWSSAGTLPVNLTQAEEIGPQAMMPNNIVLVVGANGLTALYNANTSAWSQGPTLPLLNGQQLDVADGPATVLTNGNVLIAASPGVYSTPAQFVLYNGKKKIKLFPTPASAVNDSSYNIRLLLLPTGQVLETDDSGDVEIYTGPSAAYRGIAPKITSVPMTLVRGSTYTISGKRFNGASQTNFYGDDDQQASNYPLVRITNSGSGSVAYARTYGFSSMAIGSSAAVSASFVVPSGIGTGPAELEVVTNGIASKAVSVTIDSSR